MSGERVRIARKRYGKRLFLCVHYRPVDERFFRSLAVWVDPLPKPSRLGVRLGVSFYPEDEEGQRSLHVGLLVLLLHITWDRGFLSGAGE